MTIAREDDTSDYGITAWVDWNADYDFADPGEEFPVAYGVIGNGPHTVAVTAPAAAALGQTRMRVAVAWEQAPVYEGFMSWGGEVEDYTVNVVAGNAAPAISGTTPDQAVGDNATISPFAGVTIADGDTPAQTLTTTVSLDSAEKGALAGGGFSAGPGGVYTYTGTAADTTTALRALVFTPAANRSAPGGVETTTFTILSRIPRRLQARTTRPRSLPRRSMTRRSSTGGTRWRP